MKKLINNLSETKNTAIGSSQEIKKPFKLASPK